MLRNNLFHIFQIYSEIEDLVRHFFIVYINIEISHQSFPLHNSIY